MSIHRLADAGIRNVDRLFVPAGLPLVSKAGTERPTTSILVRGGPGTGKTTMSLAFAHAIARENAGTVLFLTTEFSPAEVVAKASLLGLPEESVLAWARRGDAQQGSILVQHLAETGISEAEDEPSPSAERKQRAMEAVWSMLRDDAAPATPVRAVVIDAFGLPDPEEKAGKLRSDLVPFIQALEKRGISTVLVEEAIAGGPDWLAFVTDVVFELAFQADGDSGDLHRKLVCKKSRYAQAIPGPHDYGLEVLNERPSVFPDPLLSLSNSRPGDGAIPRERRGALFIPLDEEGEAVIFRNGGLLLNAFDRAGSKLTHAFAGTPDLRSALWECGPVSTLSIDQRRVRLHERVGPYAACDAVLSVLDEANANAVVIHNIGTLTSSSRYRTGLPRVLDALRRRGCLVLVHGTSAELAPFGPFADLDAENQRRGAIRIRSERYCPVTVHLPSLETLQFALRKGPFDTMPGEAEGQFVSGLLDALRSAEAQRDKGDIEAALDRLKVGWEESELAAWSPWIATAYFLLSIVWRRLGVNNDPRWTYVNAREVDLESVVPELSGMDLYTQFDSQTTLHGPLAWAFAVMCNEPAAAYWSLQAFERVEAATNLNGTLWAALQAASARSPGPLEALLKVAVTKGAGSLFIGLALRALLAQKRAGDVDGVIDEYLKHNPLPLFLERRLRAEPLLRAADRSLREKARDDLLALINLPDIPALHRAEIFHNIGYAHERLGKMADARPWYERARNENPHLTAATEALARFNKPQAPGVDGKPSEPEEDEDPPDDDAEGSPFPEP